MQDWVHYVDKLSEGGPKSQESFVKSLLSIIRVNQIQSNLTSDIPSFFLNYKKTLFINSQKIQQDYVGDSISHARRKVCQDRKFSPWYCITIQIDEMKNKQIQHTMNVACINATKDVMLYLLRGIDPFIYYLRCFGVVGYVHLKLIVKR